MQDLAGRVAVVTGGAGGIGRAMGERFAAEGMRVVLADVDADPLDETVEALRAAGHDATGVVTDVTDFASVERLRDAALDALRRRPRACATTPASAPAPRARCGTTRSTTGAGRSA